MDTISQDTLYSPQAPAAGSLYRSGTSICSLNVPFSYGEPSGPRISDEQTTRQCEASDLCIDSAGARASSLSSRFSAGHALTPYGGSDSSIATSLRMRARIADMVELCVPNVCCVGAKKLVDFAYVRYLSFLSFQMGQVEETRRSQKWKTWRFSRNSAMGAMRRT
jgi:hypothetical protein